MDECRHGDLDDWPLHQCENPACGRLTSALYCCRPCDLAHEYKYDPDGYHSEQCDERAARRGPAPVTP